MEIPIMPFIPNQLPNTGLYVPTTSVYDIGRIYELDVNSDEFKELLVRLYQSVNNIAVPLNQKDSGLYQTQEFVDGQVWFNPQSTSINEGRVDFRTVVNFGPLPNATQKSVPHNIPIDQANNTVAMTNPYSFTRIYGVASRQSTATGLIYLPLPFASAVSVADNIELYADDTDVVITTGTDYSSFTICYVVLEYLKN